MTFERRGPRDYLQEVRGGAANRRWQAAFELSRSLRQPAAGGARRRSPPRRCGSSRRSRPGARTICSVRRYLVLVLGRLGEPAGRAGAAPGREGRGPGHPALRDLGARKDRRPGRIRHRPRGVPIRGRRACARWPPTSSARSATRAPIPRLQVLAEDRVADVRWNAAIALGAARRPRPACRCCARCSTAPRWRRQAALSSEQAEAAMVNALKALVLLRDTESLPALEAARPRRTPTCACATPRARPSRRSARRRRNALSAATPVLVG